jgi:hypothetical protein
MQLDGPSRSSLLRHRLSAAACVLLASTAPAPARADDATPSTQVDASSLFYGENQRTKVVEPTVRVTRLFANGQSMSGELGLDAITGASPSGASPTGQVQTTTSASGTVTTIPAGLIPTHPFSDVRGGFDADWTLPVGALFTSTTGFHLSQEKDYRSLGVNATFSLDVLHRWATLTVGGGINRDQVDPVGGTVVGLTDGSTLLTRNPDSKRVTSGLAGISHPFSRRCIVGVSATREIERGYLTEPYKVVSVVDGTTGFPASELREKRPDTRARSSVMASSVYHLTDDVVYANYRYYWDDWGVRSHTVDLKYRHELPAQIYVQPHLRMYAQTQADFFTFDLVDGAPLPAFASSDERLGPLRTATVGATIGFHIPNAPGEWSLRPEYIRQWGKGHPSNVPGAQRTLNLFPPLDIGSLLVTYSIGF